MEVKTGDKITYPTQFAFCNAFTRHVVDFLPKQAKKTIFVKKVENWRGNRVAFPLQISHIDKLTNWGKLMCIYII